VLQTRKVDGTPPTGHTSGGYHHSTTRRRWPGVARRRRLYSRIIRRSALGHHPEGSFPQDVVANKHVTNMSGSGADANPTGADRPGLTAPDAHLSWRTARSGRRSGATGTAPTQPAPRACGYRDVAHIRPRASLRDWVVPAFTPYTRGPGRNAYSRSASGMFRIPSVDPRCVSARLAPSRCTCLRNCLLGRRWPQALLLTWFVPGLQSGGQLERRSQPFGDAIVDRDRRRVGGT
jgi:hypothetical protein